MPFALPYRFSCSLSAGLPHYVADIFRYSYNLACILLRRNTRQTEHGAVNQAVKAIAISRGFLSPVGIEVACIPSFADIVIDGEYRTAIRFAIDPRYTRGTPIEDSSFGE